MKIQIVVPILLLSVGLTILLSAKNYVNYFTGNTIDSITNAQGEVCLMGAHVKIMKG